MERLKEDIVAGPMLGISDPPQIFYIKTDWYKYVMGTVLLQEYDLVEAINL